MRTEVACRKHALSTLKTRLFWCRCLGFCSAARIMVTMCGIGQCCCTVTSRLVMVVVLFDGSLQPVPSHNVLSSYMTLEDVFSSDLGLAAILL